MTAGALAASCFAVAALPSARLARPHARATQAAPGSDAVIDWNRFLLGLQATPGNQPATVHPTYELAIMHAAIADAVDRTGSEAAADAAAHDTLVALYPNL